MPDTQSRGRLPQEGRMAFLRVGEAIRELNAIIGLDTFYVDLFTGKPFLKKSAEEWVDCSGLTRRNRSLANSSIAVH